MGTSRFLSGFPEVATEEWESAIRTCVREPDYPAKLVWHAEEGMDVKPYYRREDLDRLGSLVSDACPACPELGKRQNSDWRILEEVDAADSLRANQDALEAIAAGADEISFRVKGDLDRAYLTQLLGGLDELPVRLAGLDQQAAHVTAGWLRDRPNRGHVSTDIDPLADVHFSAELCRNFPESRLLCLNAEEYEENGLTSTEQIAFLLSAAVELFDQMQQRDVSVTQAVEALTFRFSVGPKFFLEIAKLRAFRLLCAKTLHSFGGGQDFPLAVIYARTARWNKTVYDPHVNVLRATTEAMSAVFGGADSITVTPFDECYRTPLKASRALARNLQLLLKHEAGFARVADPLRGAYLIEVLTNKVAAGAWKLFQEIEAGGGFSTSKATAFIDRIAERRSADRKEAVSRRKLALTGTNRFADVHELALERTDPELPNARLRAAQPFEELRFRSERAFLNGGHSRIILAAFGDARMSEARAQFAADFFACAGLRTAAVRCDAPLEVAQVEASLIVLCSSDQEYLPFAKQLMATLSTREQKVNVAIAGNPECAKELQGLGIEHFIHVRSNAVDVLSAIQQKLQIGG
ncbi:methylmalonyl-CoA mutase family protein [Occallatibacter savannae]|uniref:methylmalonyl-CoA mutase family protein n=1 Tax=Occallatibacter savannae TaxID=1002691 RepID=UPI000D69DE15|nr:methylmalonyl-CoA mutase family protein [Occallatibacter savannae]